jgi:NhaP-type Na+/H+ or K+/H+ antiporter
MHSWVVPAVAVLLLAYGAVSARLRATAISPAMVFVAVGLLMGGGGLALVDTDSANSFVRLLAEITLALVLFTDAVRINVHTLRRESVVPARLLGLGLPLTIGIGTLVGLVVFAGLDVWTAAALATILAPTDAALGLPVVNNRRLPSRIRQGLNVESGLNDGVCVPLLIIFLTLAEAEGGEQPIGPFHIIVEEIGFGVLAGVVAGLLGAFLLRVFARKGWMQPTWMQINAVATAAMAYTVAASLGGSGFIGAFVAGIVYRAMAAEPADSSTVLAEQSGELFNAVTFLLFGAVLLGPALGALDWRIALYAVLSLTVVRMLPVALAMLGTGMGWVTIGFLGWFGPRGLASIVFVLLLVEQTDLPERALIVAVVTWTVALSVFLHGMTASYGARRYADWYEKRGRGPTTLPESVSTTVQRTRVARADGAGTTARGNHLRKE